MPPRRTGPETAGDWADASPERARAVLMERARALAQPVDVEPEGDRLELVSFTLATETFAIESRYVVQVFRLEDLALLPGAEAPVFGVTAWRGELLTVLDLRPVLGLPVTALNDLSRVIVLGAGRAECGILADAVLELLSVPASELSLPSERRGIRPEVLRGITGNAVLVLDGPRLLSLTGPESAERNRL